MAITHELNPSVGAIKRAADSTFEAQPLSAKHLHVEASPPNAASYLPKDDGKSATLNLAWADCDLPFSLVWDCEDAHDHSWFKYQRQNNLTGVTWTFEVTVDAIARPLDSAVDGLTLRITLADGSNRDVRLWNYRVSGTSTSARFTVNFGSVSSGTTANTPVDCSNVKRLALIFAHSSSGSATKYANYVYSTVQFVEIERTGTKIRYNRAQVNAHHLQMSVDYDDSRHLAPQRIVEQIVGLGYTKLCTVHVGVAHPFRLGWDAAETRYRYVDQEQPINNAASAWLQDLTARLRANGIAVVFSLSYQMLNSRAPLSWRQLTWAGEPALTGLEPAATHLAFLHADVKRYLRRLALQCLALLPTGAIPYLQIREPAWWDGSALGQGPCFYDTATKDLYALTYTGAKLYNFTSLHDAMTDSAAVRTATFLREQLGKSTLDLAQSVRTVYSAAQVGVLFSTTLAFAAPVTQAVNYPKTQWKAPAFSFFQLHAHDDIVEGRMANHDEQITAVKNDLAYANANCHYVGGVVPRAGQAIELWPRIFKGVHKAEALGIQNLALWSYTQVERDSLVVYEPIVVPAPPPSVPAVQPDRPIPHTPDSLRSRDLWPRYMSDDRWLDLADALDAVQSKNLLGAFTSLKYLRHIFVPSDTAQHRIKYGEMLHQNDFLKPDEPLAIKQTEMLGLAVNAAPPFNVDYCVQLNRNLGPYWYRKGLAELVDFLGFTFDTKFNAENLWTTDYITFYPKAEAGTPIWNGGTWYPTTHVRINYDPQTFPTTYIRLFLTMFSEVSNYNLVIESLYTNTTRAIAHEGAPIVADGVSTPAKILLLGQYRVDELTLESAPLP